MFRRILTTVTLYGFTLPTLLGAPYTLKIKNADHPIESIEFEDNHITLHNRPLAKDAFHFKDRLLIDRSESSHDGVYDMSDFEYLAFFTRTGLIYSTSLDGFRKTYNHFEHLPSSAKSWRIEYLPSHKSAVKPVHALFRSLGFSEKKASRYTARYRAAQNREEPRSPNTIHRKKLKKEKPGALEMLGSIPLQSIGHVIGQPAETVPNFGTDFHSMHLLPQKGVRREHKRAIAGIKPGTRRRK